MGSSEQRPKCPKCGGWLYREPVVMPGGYTSMETEKVGMEIVCVMGHRFTVSPRKITAKKKRKE